MTIDPVLQSINAIGVAALFTVAPLVANTQVHFQSNSGLPGNSVAVTAMAVAPDSGAIVVGWGGTYGMAVKVKADGTGIEWARSLQADARDVAIASNGTIYLVDEYGLGRLNAALNWSWRAYLTTLRPVSMSMAAGTDPTVLCQVAGNFTFIALVKLDASGTIQWSHRFEIAPNNTWVGKDLEHRPDGSSIALGEGGSGGAAGPILVRFDTDGNMTWGKIFTGSSDEGVVDMTLTADGGIAVCSYEDLLRDETVLFKFDGNGVFQWGKRFSIPDTNLRPASVHERSNGDLVITGRMHNNAGPAAAFAIRTTSSGALVSTSAFSHDLSPQALGNNGVSVRNPSGGWYLAGNDGADFSTVRLVSTDADFQIGCGVYAPAVTVANHTTTEAMSLNLPTIDSPITPTTTGTIGQQIAGWNVLCVPDAVESISAADLWVAPNPVADILRFDLATTAPFDVRVVDALGRVVHKERMLAGGGERRLDLSHLNGGTYLLLLEGYRSKRIVVE